MTAPRISDRDMTAIRKRYWTEKARQEREDMAQDIVVAEIPWFKRVYVGTPVGTW